MMIHANTFFDELTTIMTITDRWIQIVIEINTTAGVQWKHGMKWAHEYVRAALMLG